MAFASLYSLVFVVGLPLNIAALCVFHWAERSVTTVYMKNLAFCDMLLLASLPLRIYYYSRRPDLPPAVCEVAGLLLLVNMYGSIFLLTCISWDRCMAVCLPLSPRARAMRQQAKYICAGVWALSVAGTIPTYIVRSKEKGGCRTLCFDRRPHYIMAPSVSSAMVLAFALPLTVMVICSYSLLQAVHRSAVAQMELVDGAKIQHMVVANVAIFLGCFLPFHVAVLCYQVPALAGERLALAYQCVLLLACANATLDPLAYYFATETFRHLVPVDHLLRSLASHSNPAEGAELLAQPLEAQQPVASGMKAPALEGAAVPGAGQAQCQPL
ncbi:lysophosphatidic acid receptor 6-like [Elgaria multicarinata webbii]|uniref:lysophosphatidic acid receptor 6-like n=1 Tax=Elgaria multicarinata webbii TaxID=159646 RepID=UPI002FCD0FB8